MYVVLDILLGQLLFFKSAKLGQALRLFLFLFLFLFWLLPTRIFSSLQMMELQNLRQILLKQFFPS